MNRGIIITTSPHTIEWLTDECLIPETEYPIVLVVNGWTPEELQINPRAKIIDPLKDIKGCYKVELFYDNGFELAGINYGKQNFDEFIYLMDTTHIKDPSIFSQLFNMEGHVFLSERGFHYQGKFVSADLPFIPEITTKKEAIGLELNWLQRPYAVFEPPLPYISDVFEDRHGRLNMRLENEHMVKWKGTWQ